MDRARPRGGGQIRGRLVGEGVDGQLYAIARGGRVEELRTASGRRARGFGAIVDGRALVFEGGIDAVGLDERAGLRGPLPHLGPRGAAAAARLQRFVEARAGTRSHRTGSGLIVVGRRRSSKGRAAGGRARWARAGAQRGRQARATHGAAGSGQAACCSAACSSTGRGGEVRLSCEQRRQGTPGAAWVALRSPGRDQTTAAATTVTLSRLKARHHPSRLTPSTAGPSSPLRKISRLPSHRQLPSPWRRRRTCVAPTSVRLPAVAACRLLACVAPHVAVTCADLG